MSSHRIAIGYMGKPDAPASALAAHISTMKPSSGYDRAALLRDVIDGFVRLRNSVLRFVQLFTSDASAPRAHEMAAAASLRGLLSLLASEAQAAQFDRMRELKRAIRDARSLEKTRDAVFSESFSNDPVALQAAAAELERVDALLVGLCVEHVLERHLATAIYAPRADAVAEQRPRVAPRRSRRKLADARLAAPARAQAG
ncbi:hypothetical protein GCM10027093_64120 [Paraburkholderia jirisanensis]